MTDEQINIAIAEACGWKLLSNNRWTQPNGDYGDTLNYCNDLNAIHEAEKVLQQNMAKWWNYVAQLAVVNAALGHGGEAHATARQRAEAFLRTLGKWEEDSK